MVFKTKTRLKMDMGNRGLLIEYIHLFGQLRGELWDLPGNYKKLWLREVTVAIKCLKRIRSRLKSGGGIYRQIQRVYG